MVCEGFPRRKPVMFWLCWKIFDPNWVLNLKDQSLLSNRHWPPQSWRDPQRLKPAKAQLAVALEVFIPGHLCIDRGEDGCPTWR